MGNYDLGTATGTIEIKYQDKGTKAAQNDLEGVGTSAKKAGVSAAQLSRGMGVAGAVVAAGLGVAVKAAANFEQGLSNIKAVSGATAETMEQVRQKALQIGKDTSFSATDAASAMEELAKAGLSTEEILNGAADATVALAAAGEIDLPQAAAIASNALNQFSLEAQDLPNVADKIAGAANASAISVGEFGQSLSQVGAVANLAGLSFDDTAIAIAEMGNAGIKGSDAGTSLKTMLANLQPTTKKAADQMKELGIITEDGSNRFYDQQGRLKSLKDVQEILRTSMTGMTDAQKQAALQVLFGSDAIRAAAVLSKEGAKGYTEMSTAMGKVKAADVAATKLDNFNGSVEALKGSAETLAIQLGTVLLPTIRDIVDKVTEAVNWFSQLSPETQEMAVQAAVAAAAFLLLGAGLIKVVGFVQQFVGAVKLIAGVAKLGPLFTILGRGIMVAAGAFRALTIAMLSNPIGLIIIAVIALVAAIILLWKNSETFRNIVMAVWNAIKVAVGAVADWFMNTVVPGFMKAMSDIGGFFTGLWHVAVDVWNAISDGIGAAVKFIYTIIKTYLNLYIGAWKLAWSIISTVVKAVWGVIKGTIQAALNIINGIIRSVFTALRNFITTVVNGWKNIISNAFNAILNITRTVWNSGFVTTIRNAINQVFQLVGQIRNRVVSALSGATSWLYNAGRNIIRGLINGIKSMIGEVKSQLSNLTGLIPDWKGPERKDKVLLEENGEWILEGFMNGIENKIKPLRSLLQGITTNIPASFTDPRTSMSPATQQRLSETAAPITGSPVTVNNYNPVAEPSSVTTTKSLTRIAQLGVLG